MPVDTVSPSVLRGCAAGVQGQVEQSRAVHPGYILAGVDDEDTAALTLAQVVEVLRRPTENTRTLRFRRGPVTAVLKRAIKERDVALQTNVFARISSRSRCSRGVPPPTQPQTTNPSNIGANDH